MEKVLFMLILALLLVHEMDAIYNREWKMFIILKDFPDETAYKIFTALHMPLYFLVILIVALGNANVQTILYYVIDLFLLAHAVVHFLFRKHKENRFESMFSKTIIYSMAVLASAHLILQIL